MGIKPMLLISLTILMTFQCAAQLKKAHLGQYAGEIGSYEISTGQELFTIQPVAVHLELGTDSLYLQIGNQHFRGTHELLLETKTYILLEATLAGQTAPERIVVYKKGKKISREGIKPQPDAILRKVKQ